MSVCSIVDVLLQLQCNVFEGTSGEVTLTATGGVRQLPGPAGSEIQENAALNAIWYPEISEEPTVLTILTSWDHKHTS